jgi:transcriptional regulator with XRE-family HTH domain
MGKTLVEKYVEDSDHMRLFQQERAIYEVTATLKALMEKKGVSRAELARLLGRTKGWVTQLLDGEANKTIRTVADAFAVLGDEFHSSSQPIQISNAPAAPAAAMNPAGGMVAQTLVFGAKERHLQESRWGSPSAFISESFQAIG